MRILTFVFHLMLIFLLAPLSVVSQTGYLPGQIRQKLEKLNVLGSVLYVAAHPDDENTRLISYFSNENLMRTAYLSATRGDGGQNLIGAEIKEELGLIRTQELLVARSIDGGQQFFSRANDFGYSKNPDETFTIWDKKKVLADFVWTFRKFKPDIIITRFNHEGKSHGHHTASALLAREAFKLSGDKNIFPEQLAYVDTWIPKKMFWNTGWWWFRNSKRDTTNLKKIDVGKYNALLGESYTEMAARSRSMHKSQGFGTSSVRGMRIEYLEQWEGEDTDNIFEGIDTSWGRVKGSEEVASHIKKAIDLYREEDPSVIIAPLIEARKALERLQDDFWKEIKKKEIEELIVEASGLYVSFKSDQSSYTVGDSILIELELVNRSNVEMILEEVKFSQWSNTTSLKTSLLNNKVVTLNMKLYLPRDMDNTHPYWLRKKGEKGMYTVDDQEQIGNPENDPAILGKVTISVGKEKIELDVPVVYKYVDPVEGEVTEPIAIEPPVMMNISNGVLVFGNNQSKSIDVRVIAGKDNCEGTVILKKPDGWKISPSKHVFNLSTKGEEQIFSFIITPPSYASEGFLEMHAKIAGRTYQKSSIEIDYEHIPKQKLYPKASMKVVRVDMKKKGNLVGYIKGSGDAIPQNIEQVGYTVEILSKDDVNQKNLQKYDAIILGIRAFNTVEWLSYKNAELFSYVKFGGTLIVQYNTSHRLVTKEIAPFPLTLSRDRVAVEYAPVRILAMDHPVMNTPNKISDKDFQGWVQERGLYFPNEWSEEFTPVLESNDPGENPKNGGLLVAKYGEGYYVYSSYSWFRELPAGIAGAYRIFVNLISLGK